MNARRIISRLSRSANGWSVWREAAGPRAPIRISWIPVGSETVASERVQIAVAEIRAVQHGDIMGVGLQSCKAVARAEVGAERSHVLAPYDGSRLGVIAHDGDLDQPRTVTNRTYWVLSAKGGGSEDSYIKPNLVVRVTVCTTSVYLGTSSNYLASPSRGSVISGFRSTRSLSPFLGRNRGRCQSRQRQRGRERCQPPDRRSPDSGGGGVAGQGTDFDGFMGAFLFA